MGKNSTVNSEELELFRGLTSGAIVREHAVLRVVISVARLVSPGDWASVSALARGLDEASEQFNDGLREVAGRHGLIGTGQRLFDTCDICGGSWCSAAPLIISKKVVAWWDTFTAQKTEED